MKFFAFLLLATGLLLAGCMQLNSSGATTASSNTSQSQVQEIHVQEFSMTASDWQFEPSTITVKKGMPVKITITSTDVTHGFGLIAFNINQRIEPGKTTVVEFTPDKTGTFPFRCSVLCGSGHGTMKGTLIVTD